jgi:hypothetical protein
MRHPHGAMASFAARPSAIMRFARHSPAALPLQPASQLHRRDKPGWPAPPAAALAAARCRQRCRRPELVKPCGLPNLPEPLTADMLFEVRGCDTLEASRRPGLASRLLWQPLCGCRACCPPCLRPPFSPPLCKTLHRCLFAGMQATGVPLLDELMRMPTVDAALAHSIRLGSIAVSLALLGTLVVAAVDKFAGRRLGGTSSNFNAPLAALASAFKPAKVRRHGHACVTPAAVRLPQSRCCSDVYCQNRACLASASLAAQALRLHPDPVLCTRETLILVCRC